MKNCLATSTKISKGNGVTETFRLANKLQLNPVEEKYKLLLDQEEDGQPAWFLTAKSYNFKLLKELWALAKEKGSPEEIKYNLLLARNEYGETALHMAAGGSVAVMEKMCFFKESQLNEDKLNNELLLAKDKYTYTDWKRAPEKSSLEELEILWS